MWAPNRLRLSVDATPTHRPDSPDDILQALRHRVLRLSLTMLAVAMPIISVAMTISALYSGTFSLQVIIVTSATVVFPLLRYFSKTLGYDWSALLLVAFLAASAFLLASRGGLTVGYAALCVMVLQLSTLFFMRRGALIGLMAVLTLHVVAWAIYSHRVGPPVALLNWDPSSNLVWARHFIILSLFGLAIARGQLYVVEQLAESVSNYRNLAEREKAQRLALEQAEREREREREQRAHAQLALERSRRTEALARVAGGVAHDFNNALTIILGAAEAAKDAPEDLDVHLNGIVDAARHAAALTNQLLTLGHQRLSTPADLSIVSFLTRLRPSLASGLPADIVLTMALPESDVLVRVDQISLERAIFNLVLNARDAMPRGGHITVSGRRDVVTATDQRVGPGTYIALEVADDGVGMDRETAEHVFDLFFTTKGDKGTGLGLPSVHAFVEEAGGAIDVVSSPGRGTAFTLWLPEVVGRDAASAQAASPASALSALRGRVLVVDDIPVVRTIMTRVLSRRGLEVIEAGDGDAALELLRSMPGFALMCIDGVMPGLSTATTIERARQIAPDLPVLVCSGHVQEELLRRGIETGRYELLQKPFTSEALIEKISRALNTPDRPAGAAPGK